jgi:hypothetical protein
MTTPATPTPAAEQLTELVGDFLYDWQDTGENPSLAARRLLLVVFRSKLIDEAMAQLHGGGI